MTTNTVAIIDATTVVSALLEIVQDSHLPSRHRVRAAVTLLAHHTTEHSNAIAISALNEIAENRELDTNDRIVAAETLLSYIKYQSS